MASCPTPVTYTTIAQPTRTELEVKKSRFVVTAWPVLGGSLAALDLIRKHSDLGASHNCWAYRLANDEYRSSDDGEPGGTAGRPILAAIEGEKLHNVAVLVTRYFGGIKLGAGGLARAYTGAASECLRAAPRAVVRARQHVQLHAGFEVLGTVHNVLSQYGQDCQRVAEDFDDQGALMTLSVDAEIVEALGRALADATAGKVALRATARPGSSA